MRILFIRTQKFDYLQDLTYSGLTKLLGAENVIEYKWNINYHVRTKKYPRSVGYIAGSFLGSIKAQLKRRWFDLVILAGCKPDIFEHYLFIVKKIPQSVPVVFIDGGDMSTIGGDLVRLGHPELFNKALVCRPFDLIFKREYLLEADHGKDVFPLPFSFNMDVAPNINGRLKYDVAFWAVESHPIRTTVLELIGDQFDCKKNGSACNQVFRKYDRKGEKYLKELSCCKVALNFRGAGWDTLRYWEIPAVGRMLLSQKPKILVPNNFKHEESVIFCRDDLSDLLELCAYYLKNEKERESIAGNARTQINQYHTDVKRAEYILNKIKPLL